MNAYKLGRGTCNDERRWECMLRDPFILAKTKTRLIHAKYSEKVPVTTSAKESTVFETILPQQKKETTILHAKNLEKVRAQRRVQF